MQKTQRALSTSSRLGLDCKSAPIYQIIGVQTAREIETLDMDTAELFYQVSEITKKMISKNK
jgi:hypothetical protein